MSGVPARTVVEGPCAYCLAKTIEVRAPGGPPAWRVPMLRFGEIFHDAWEVTAPLEDCGGGVGLPGPRLGLAEDGRLVACAPGARRGLATGAPDGGTPVRVRYLHAISCAHWQGRDWAPGERGICSGCSSVIHWIVTPAGKRAPIDPKMHSGRLLSRMEALAAKGTPGLVIGLDSRGEQRSIREGELSLVDTGDPVAVWVNHFATCPERERFAR